MQTVADALPHSLFWDTNPQKLDWESHAVFIANRVVERGDYSHFKMLLALYGRERFKHLVLQAPTLSPKTLSFLCAFFQLTPEQFKCYKNTPSAPHYWI
jgi:hypothetical protein